MTIWPDASFFAPDPRLFRPDADMYLIFLSGNGVAFYDPTNDPWYRGFVPWKEVNTLAYEDNINMTVYRPDEAASPMGCIQQWQYCNAEHKCGELASYYDAVTTAAPCLNTSLEAALGYADVSGQTSSQFAYFGAIMYSAQDLITILRVLGVAALDSSRQFESGFVGPIPSDQWKLDVTHWWTTMLAAKQAAFVNAAHGTKDPALLNTTAYPGNEYMEELCHSQVSVTKLSLASFFWHTFPHVVFQRRVG